MTGLCLFLLSGFGCLYYVGSLTATACYGTIPPDHLKPRCHQNQLMRVDGVYALAKKTATSCPQEHIPGTGADPDLCCTFNAEDCKMPYTGVSNYYVPCVSENNCTVNVAWQDTTCNETGFLPRSNYMMTEYTCVPKDELISVTSSGVSVNPITYISGPNHSESSLPQNINGICSVMASCTSGTSVITITAIDLDLQTDGSGQCQQYIDVEDGSSTHRISCTDNNAKIPKILYTSQSDFLIVRFYNTLNVDAGNIWIEFKGSNPDVSVDVRCGLTALSSRSGSDECFTTGSTERLTTATQRLISGPDPSTATGTIIGIVLGLLLLLLLLLIIIIILCVYKKKKKRKIKISDSKSELMDEEFAKALGISGLSGTVAGVAPASSALSRPPPRLPKLPPVERTGDAMSSTQDSVFDSVSSKANKNKTSVFEISRN